MSQICGGTEEEEEEVSNTPDWTLSSVSSSTPPPLPSPPFNQLPRLHPQPHRPSPASPPRPSSVLAVGLGGDTGAVSYQQSHRARTGHSDRHAGGAHGAGARLVGGGVALVGVGAHVTLELRGRLALHPAQLAEQHAAGPRPAEAPSCPAALLPLLTMMLLSVDTQVGERGEAWITHTHTQVECFLFTAGFTY